ncbi:alpha-glucan family phosphorylase [Agrococcus sp. HG114]|uniref:alpha-glucan family phosphorylase n=1 Tax=Agrococcus sp. HG114 TaxID=2969757 RepID=UPI00215A74B3|nr:alpha-glucan family phosphorylase [Agrococcus sp. HG114]MCR8670905.1 alpha-glucan family phosphorylase [Agrococcus sp. HG114]
MRAIRRFTVRTSLPEPLRRLEQLASNLRWSWHEPTRELFREISLEGWRATGHDPVQLLGWVGTERLEQLAADDAFVARVDALADDLDHYLSQARWYQSLEDAPEAIAYFSPEFGITSALPQYSGGLGILAGDHLKAASDLGVPIVGVGLFYQAGYFKQAISREGWQEETYPVLDPDGLPLTILRRPDGAHATVAIALPGGRTLHARIWQATIGRVPLLLLDTNILENDDDLRRVADRLYGGGGEHRLQQELLLGIGGVRALDVYAELTGAPKPGVFHSNEGHAGFLGIERVSQLVSREGLSFDEALAVVRAGTVFTTHTPVPAGIDRFDVELVRRHLTHELVPGVDVERVLALGREEDPAIFNMAQLGFSIAQRANGVSKLHGAVSRAMFHERWPGFDTDEVPITSVTNGVHASTWTSPVLKHLAERELGTLDTTRCDWASDAVSDETIWAARNEMRRQTIEDARARTRRKHERNEGVAPAWIDRMLDPDVLTIGFARRVPTYKRLTLMLHDRDRLRALLTHPERPVQLIIAGKSHPADEAGKGLIQELVRFSQEPEVRGRIVFLENYDISMAKTLYPGCDVWLNNPLRPLEACGTSGMKAALNGSLNLSILDGWWEEYFDGKNGWAIPSAHGQMDAAQRDAFEANALYELIEHQVAPRFYDRDERGLPAAWIASIRHTLATLSPELSAERMLAEYVTRLYAPAGRAAAVAGAEGAAAGREFAAWTGRMRDAFGAVEVRHVEVEGVDTPPIIGDTVRVRALVGLGALSPEDVTVEVVAGTVTEEGELRRSRRFALDPVGPEGDSHRFEAAIPLSTAGTFGYTVRVVPKHPMLADEAELGLVAYAKG